MLDVRSRIYAKKWDASPFGVGDYILQNIDDLNKFTIVEIKNIYGSENKSDIRNDVKNQVSKNSILFMLRHPGSKIRSCIFTNEEICLQEIESKEVFERFFKMLPNLNLIKLSNTSYYIKDTAIFYSLSDSENNLEKLISKIPDENKSKININEIIPIFEISKNLYEVYRFYIINNNI